MGSYTAHSVRDAAGSAAFLKGMSVLDIIKVTDWSSDNTFKAFYYKPISEQKSLFPLLVRTMDVLWIYIIIHFQFVVLNQIWSQKCLTEVVEWFLDVIQ